MTFNNDIPTMSDSIGDDIPSIQENFEHLKDSISEEHDWSDSAATSCVHSEGSGRIFVSAIQPETGSIGKLWYDTANDILYYDNGSTWTEVDLSGSLLPVAGGTMSGEIAMGDNKITGVGTPTANTDAATKGYADTVAAGGGATHAESHVDGTDDIQSATDSQKGVMTAADHVILSELDDTNTRQRMVSWYLDGSNPPTEGTTNYQPALIFSATADNIAYIRQEIVPAGKTGCLLAFSARMNTANAGNVIIKMVPVIDGALQSEKTLTLTTSYHGGGTTLFSVASASLTWGTLSEGQIIGAKFYRDGDNASDTHSGTFLLVHARLVWTG